MPDLTPDEAAATDLAKTRALMGISESVTIGQPTLGLVHAALVEAADLRARLAAQQPVIDAAQAWDGAWVMGTAGVKSGTALHNALVQYEGTPRRAALSGSVEARPSIEELVERSSLGTPEAKAARARTSDEQVEKVMARLRAREDARQRVIDAAGTWVGWRQRTAQAEGLEHHLWGIQDAVTTLWASADDAALSVSVEADTPAEPERYDHDGACCTSCFNGEPTHVEPYEDCTLCHPRAQAGTPAAEPAPDDDAIRKALADAMEEHDVAMYRAVGYGEAAARSVVQAAGRASRGGYARALVPVVRALAGAGAPTEPNPACAERVPGCTRRRSHQHTPINVAGAPTEPPDAPDWPAIFAEHVHDDTFREAFYRAERAYDDAHCSCGGARWVDDEGWSPEFVGDRRQPGGPGRLPCGFCNHGGWDVEDTAATRAAALAEPADDTQEC